MSVLLSLGVIGLRAAARRPLACALLALFATSGASAVEYVEVPAGTLASVLAHDAEIRNLVEPRLLKLESFLHGRGNSRRVHGAYAQ